MDAWEREHVRDDLPSFVGSGTRNLVVHLLYPTGRPPLQTAIVEVDAMHQLDIDAEQPTDLRHTDRLVVERPLPKGKEVVLHVPEALDPENDSRLPMNCLVEKVQLATLSLQNLPSVTSYTFPPCHVKLLPCANSSWLTWGNYTLIEAKSQNYKLIWAIKSPLGICLYRQTPQGLTSRQDDRSDPGGQEAPSGCQAE